MTTVDIVVAVCNEEDSLPLFVDQIRRLIIPDSFELSLLFVEDSSTDSTLDLLVRFSDEDTAINFLSLERGYGQAAAIWYGLTKSCADVVIMMDVDGQHPIDLIPSMLVHYAQGAQVVQANRRDLTRSGGRKLGARCFNQLMRLLTGVNLSQQTVFYRLVTREFKDAMLRYPRISRFLRISLPSGGKAQVINYDYVERNRGQSKYNLGRLVRFAFTGILSSISTVRFVTAALIMCGVAGALWYYLSASILCVLLLSAVGIVSAVYFRMATDDVADKIVVKLDSGQVHCG